MDLIYNSLLTNLNCWVATILWNETGEGKDYLNVKSFLCLKGQPLKKGHFDVILQACNNLVLSMKRQNLK